MTSWQADDVQVDGLRLHYTRTGGAKPPLVMVHGFSDDGLCWSAVAQRLEDQYDIIMPDARGHGLSDAPKAGYTPPDQAADLKGIIETLGLQKPLILGHSMGALTALTLAGLYPDVPGAILLEDPPAFWLQNGFRPPSTPEQLAQMQASFDERKKKSREALIAQQRSETPDWSDIELETWADSKLRLSLNIVEFFGADIASSVDWATVLPRVKCPALLITADVEKWAIVTEAAARELKAMIPQLQVAHIANAGHSIHRDQLDTYIGVIQNFLATV